MTEIVLRDPGAAALVAKREEIAIAVASAVEAKDAMRVQDLADDAQRAAVLAAMNGYTEEANKLSWLARDTKDELTRLVRKKPGNPSGKKKQEKKSTSTGQPNTTSVGERTMRAHNMTREEYEEAREFGKKHEENPDSDGYFLWYKSDFLTWRKSFVCKGKLTRREFDAETERCYSELNRRPQMVDFKRIWDKKKQAKATRDRLEHEKREAAMDVKWQPRILQSDVADLPHVLEPELADVIFVDPLYKESAIEGTWQHLLAAASHVLKPNGIMLAMSGQKYLPRVLAALESGNLGDMKYQWTIANGPFKRPQEFWHPPLYSRWKPVFVYQKAPFAEWKSRVTDVLDGETGDLTAKDAHEYGQPELAVLALLKPFVRKGMTVLDCCVGGGSTGIAARALGAEFIGSDIDADVVAKAKERLGA